MRTTLLAMVSLVVIVGGTLVAGSGVSQARSTAGWWPRPPSPVIIDEALRAFDLGARAGKGGLPKALPSTLLGDPGLNAAYATFAALRNGEKQDQVVARAACFAINETLLGSDNPREKQWESLMYSYLPADFAPAAPSFGIPAGDLNGLVSASITRVARQITITQMAPGGLRAYYSKYCF